MISETGVWNPLKGLTEFGWHFEQNVYFSGGLIRALKAGGGSGNIPKIIYIMVAILSLPHGFRKMALSGAVLPTITISSFECNNLLIEFDMEGINVLLTPEQREYIIKHARVRKLTPRDCMRLMGVSDEDFDKMRSAGISDTQLFKLAGNSIVVPVLEGIFTQMFRKDPEALF